MEEKGRCEGVYFPGAGMKIGECCHGQQGDLRTPILMGVPGHLGRMSILGFGKLGGKVNPQGAPTFLFSPARTLPRKRISMECRG